MIDSSVRRITFITSAVILAAAITWFVISTRHLPRYDYSIDDWKSEYAVYRDNGFAVDDSIKDSGERLTLFLWGPYKPLKRGSYTAVIRYTADDDQMCYTTAKGDQSFLFRSSPPILSKNSEVYNYRFEVSENIDEFQLIFPYSGNGDFIIHSISITANNTQQKRILAEITAVIFLTDLFLILLKRKEKDRLTVFLLTGIVFLVSLPLFIRGVHIGYDLEYYLLRVENIVGKIRIGQLLPGFTWLTGDDSGNTVKILQNDFFLLIIAGLRLFGFSMSTAYKIYVLFINVLTVAISYYSFSRIFGSTKAGILLTLLYASASYRMVNLYTRDDLYEFTAQAFLPLLALSFYRIYFSGTKSLKKVLADSLIFALCLSGILCSSIVVFIMSLFMVFLSALFFFKQTFQKRTVLTLGITLILTILLNLYYWMSFAGCFPDHSAPGEKMISASMIQENGAEPGAFLRFFQDVIGGGKDQMTGAFQLTPGLPLMLVFIASIYVIFRKRRSRGLVFLLILSCVTLWLSSNVFPWNWFSTHSFFGKFASLLQFPWRFLAFSVLFLTLLAGTIADRFDSHRFASLLVLCSAVMVCWFVSDFCNHSSTAMIYDTNGMGLDQTTDLRGMEYVVISRTRSQDFSDSRGSGEQSDPDVWEDMENIDPEVL